MRQKKKPDKKERNYSIWFTGITLVLVYIIILDDMSGAKESVCKSILKNQIQNLVQEKEPEPIVDVEEEQEAELQPNAELSQEEQEALWKQEGEEILRRFRESGWEEKEEKPVEFSWYEPEIVYLASIPEEGIYLYGYNDEEYQDRGVAVEFRKTGGSRYYYYDWWYLTPRMILPELFWNEKEQQLYVSLYVGSGTGYAVEELHILQCSGTETPIDFEFMWEDYIQQLERRFSCTADPQKDELIVYDEEQEIIKTILSQWIMEEENVLDLYWGDIVRYHLGEQIQMEVPVGLRTDKRAYAGYSYSNSENYNFYINIEHHIETSSLGERQMVFTLGDLSVRKEE